MSQLLLLAVKGVGRRDVVIAVAQVLAAYTDEELAALPTQREIAQRAGITEHSVRRALDRLEQLGVVEREVAAKNRRRIHVDRDALSVIVTSG